MAYRFGLCLIFTLVRHKHLDFVDCGAFKYSLLINKLLRHNWLESSSTPAVHQLIFKDGQGPELIGKFSELDSVLCKTGVVYYRFFRSLKGSVRLETVIMTNLHLCNLHLHNRSLVDPVVSQAQHEKNRLWWTKS